MDGGYTTRRSYLMSQNSNLKTVEMVNWVLGVFRHNFKINGKDTRVISRFSFEVTTKLSSLLPRGCGAAVREAWGRGDEAGSRGASASGGGPGPWMKRSRRLTSTASWPVNASFSSKCLGIRTQLSAFFKTTLMQRGCRLQSLDPPPPWCSRPARAKTSGAQEPPLPPWQAPRPGPWEPLAFPRRSPPLGQGGELAGLSQMLSSRREKGVQPLRKKPPGFVF